MFQFEVESSGNIQECVLWIMEVLNQVRSKQLADYADDVLGWMAAIAGIQSLTRSKLYTLEMDLTRRSACLTGANISVMGDLKYRTIDMLCSLDNEYCELSKFKAELEGLNLLASQSWSVLEIASRTAYRMLDLKRQESRTPLVNPPFDQPFQYKP
jgi:hypothetical protein